MISRKQICSQQIHCLSCPISVAVTGKDCRELTQQELIRIKEELIMTDTDMLYMAALEKRLETAEAENAELKARVAELEGKHYSECGQIAHYDDELKKPKNQNDVYVRKSDVLDLISAAYEDGGFTDYSDYSSLWDAVDDM